MSLFFIAVLTIHRSGALKALFGVLHGFSVLPHETAAVLVCSVYTMLPRTMSRHFTQSHILRVHACVAVTCRMYFWHECPGTFTCYCGNRR